MNNSLLSISGRFLVVVLFGLLTPSFAAQNPVPQIAQPLVPMSAAPGGPGFVLTINGSGFVSSSVVKWNGSTRPTTFVSTSRLTASVPASDIATPGAALVAVSNPLPGGGLSNTAFFQITRANSSFTFRDLSTPIIEPFSVQTGDFNGDGILDLVVTNRFSISILLGNGDGTFKSSATYGTPGIAGEVIIGDFNGDGKLDLAVANSYVGNSFVSIFIGNGDGSFQPGVDYASAAGAFAVTVGDFNGDGVLDLAVANGSRNGDAHPASNTVSILLGNGDGTFQNHVDYATGLSPSSLIAADLNRDGKLDLAVTNGASNTVSILLGNGDGTFQAQVQYQAGGLAFSSPIQLTAADFNGDGKLDLAVANAVSVSVLLGIGDGSFQAPADYSTGSLPGALTAADLDGDGRLDLVVLNQGDHGVSVLLGNGDGTFQPHIDFSTNGVEPKRVISGDFNGDGRVDLAVTNFDFGGVAILLQTPIVYSLFASTATPSVLNTNGGAPLELGMKFTSDRDGDVTGVRFYKGVSNVGPHVGSLWTSRGQLLAQVTFNNETEFGWQQAMFSQPVAITANTVYVVSYHSMGFFSCDLGFFNSPVDNPPLHALTAAYGNGVYSYGASSTFPTTLMAGANFWVDVMFR